jgi:Peroxin 13, N-terminal region
LQKKVLEVDTTKLILFRLVNDFLLIYLINAGAFQSIEQVVSTIGNIATMLDSTYFALTSSFRAILGLAANFSQMRGFFVKFFSTFTIFRSIIWIYKKLLFMAGLSKTNPSTVVNLNEAFKDAEKLNSSDFFNSSPQQGSSGLPMVLFMAFVLSAPYLIMKLFGSLMNSATDQSKSKQNFFQTTMFYKLFSLHHKQPNTQLLGKPLLTQ